MRAPVWPPIHWRQTLEYNLEEFEMNMTITSYSFIVALTEHLLCAACLVWRLLRASCRPVARQCRRRTTPTNGASGRLVRTRHDAAPSHAKALSASRRPYC